jgi:shikimate dehydrogenase
MLVAQAKESAEWFTGTEIPDSQIGRIYGMLKAQMENIVLIGMPGCGKSTVARALAERLGREAVDADLQIQRTAGMTIPQIFSEVGEDGFRKVESKVLAELGKQSGLVIATGGGCVTRPENYDALHRNGRIFWLTRSLERLPTDGRPLSQAGKLEQMYEVRRPMYERFADVTVDNDGSLERTVAQILKALEEQV